jgi:hypothetical protein
MPVVASALQAASTEAVVVGNFSFAFGPDNKRNEENKYA